MATRMFCAANNLVNSFRKLTFSNGFAKNLVNSEYFESSLLNAHNPITASIRSTSFLNKFTSAQLYKSCTGVSNAGKKRGRGRLAGKHLTKDLNRGQTIGQGRKSVLWPGLNSPVRSGSELIKQEKRPENPEWTQNLYKLRDESRNTRRKNFAQEERGYSGRRLPGKSIGEPDPIGEYEFEGFDTRCIEMKIVNVMRGNLGRWRRHSTFAVTGNGNGVAGFALGKSTDPKAAIRKAKNRAAQKLMHIKICDNHTVYHDYFCQFAYTKIYVMKKPEGYGLRCHRVIKTICELVGIKNLHARVEGSTNVQSIVKAFFLGLLQQKTYEQLAEEKGLYLVEFKKENNFFPKIVGVPSVCRKPSDISKDEILDFKQYVMNGRVALRKNNPPPFYANYPSYQIYLRRAEKRRSHEPIKFDLYTRYGELRSFLTDKYPEAKPGPRLAKETD